MESHLWIFLGLLAIAKIVPCQNQGPDIFSEYLKMKNLGRNAQSQDPNDQRFAHQYHSQNHNQNEGVYKIENLLPYQRPLQNQMAQSGQGQVQNLGQDQSRNQRGNQRQDQPQVQNLGQAQSRNQIGNQRQDQPQVQNLGQAQSRHQIGNQRQDQPQVQNLELAQSRHQIGNQRQDQPQVQNLGQPQSRNQRGNQRQDQSQAVGCMFGGRPLNVGQSAPFPGQCMGATCMGNHRLHYELCPNNKIMENDRQCRHMGKVDYKKPWPNCCPPLVCI